MTVPALPEVDTQGDTREEAMAHAREAIELVIEHRLSKGEALELSPTDAADLTGLVQERRERIQRDFEKAEKLKAETEQALASYEQALAEGRAKANAIAKDVREKLAAQVDKERAAVDTQIAKKVADAEARIAQSKAKAMANVADIAAETASAVVGKLLGKEVSKDEVQRALLQRAAE